MDNDVLEELLKIVIESLQSEEGNLNKAVDLATHFSKENLISPDSLLELSSSYGSNKSYSLAYIFAKTCAILSTEDTKKANSHFFAGYTSFFMGCREEAEEQYKLALKANPNHISTHYNYGNLLLIMGRNEEAEEQYKLALKANSNNSIAHCCYGVFLKYQGRMEEAEEQYKLALKLNPNEQTAHLNYGNLLYAMGRNEEAEEQYKLDLEANSNRAATHLNYGLFLYERGRSEEAEEQYILALEADPNNPIIHCCYGLVLNEMGRKGEAEKQYKIAIKLDPKYPNSHGAYGLLLLSINLEEEAIEETEIASRLCREDGDTAKEHLSFAWLYEEFANKYYNLKYYKKSGEYAEISGDEYIEAGKHAEEKFKSTSLTKGYTLKGRAKIRKLELQPPYEIEKFKEIMNGIYEASEFYRKAAEITPKDNQICNACSISMLCLSEMLDYMLAVIKQEKVPRLDGEIEKWKKELIVSEQIYKESPKGEAFVQSLYKLMACIENLNKYKKFAMWKEERAFEECVEELKEIAGNIEGPLQKIIEDSAAQMDICRRKIMPYAGTETGQFEPETPKTNATDTPVESETDNSNKIKVSKIDGILRWIWNHPIKSVGSVIFAVMLNHYSEDIFSLIQGFVSKLFS